jgi:hypothetical protein
MLMLVLTSNVNLLELLRIEDGLKFFLSISNECPLGGERSVLREDLSRYLY